MKSQPKLAAIEAPAQALERDSVIVRLRNAKGREVVGDRVIVRVVADLIVEATGHPSCDHFLPGQFVVARHLLANMGTELGHISPAGLGLRRLAPTETTIGYDPAVSIIFSENGDLGGGAE